jgi:osmotically-inducible protein OsmY
VIEATKPSTAPADDVELAQRVRSEVLGRREFHDLPITVDAARGVVHLRGMVDDRERAAAAIALIRDIPGVVQVDNLLHDHLHPAPNKEAALRVP